MRGNVNERWGIEGGEAPLPPIGKRRRAGRHMVVVFVLCWHWCCCCCLSVCLFVLDYFSVI